jgi:ribosomal protein L37E
MYTSAAMLFLTGIMVAYDELFVPAITCPKCGRTSYHPKDIAKRYCGLAATTMESGANSPHRARSPRTRQSPRQHPERSALPGDPAKVESFADLN